MFFCSISIIFGFNSQEWHRVDILQICKHCSCMPSCRRIIFFYFGIQNTFENNKSTCVPWASCLDLIYKSATELTFYEPAGTSAACLPAEGYLFLFWHSKYFWESKVPCSRSFLTLSWNQKRQNWSKNEISLLVFGPALWIVVWFLKSTKLFKTTDQFNQSNFQNPIQKGWVHCEN